MIDVATARPVNRMANTPTLVRQLFERASDLRLRLGADPAPGCQTEGAPTGQRECARDQHQRHRQQHVSGVGGQRSGRKRECSDSAT